MNHPSEKSIFFDALEMDDLAERNRYLDRACEKNPELRDRVVALLQASDRPDNPLDRPPLPVLPESTDEQVGDMIGKMIGPYRLMEQIGEGGFGLVFVAQQEQPVRRNVALKIVKPGTGSKEVIARFEAERQAVAMMDHPNIARVFDAGVTNDGRPYFVMELVRGVAITDFADAHRLDLRERLKLVTDVCLAVHHAHQKGVIHRDIKPSNVMVTLHDDKPVVKVIDFGVAKAIGQSLTNKTLYTRFFSMIGTPLYMSPEQAEMSGLDVDTRSDIYSLGVLMYELLVGATPFDRERMDSAGLDEMRRIIREEDPPRPSRRLSTLGARMTTVSHARREEPRHLTSSLSGDLDWIVMKALEKDRGRRYESAAAMAADVTRFLSDQPIEARPPTLAYQFAKFARRHRVMFATLSVIATTLFIATGVSLWQMKIAIDQRDQKDQALRVANVARREVEQFADRLTLANSLMSSGQSHTDAGRMRAAFQDYDDAVTQQPDYYLPWVGRAQFYTRMKLWDEAGKDFSKALTLSAPTDSPEWWGVAILFAFTKQEDALGQISDHLDSRWVIEAQAMNWLWLRECCARGDGEFGNSRSDMASLADDWLRRMDAPPPEAPTPRDRLGRPQPLDSMPRTVCEYTAGLTHMRAGHWDQAIELLSRVGDDRNWPAHGLVHAPIAISLHHSNRSQQAEEELEKSNEAIVRVASDMLSEDRNFRPTPWFDFVELLLINREANELISGKEIEPPAELLQLREQSLEAIYR